MVFAAQHYAYQEALPTSQRHGSALPGAHQDRARKAFEQLTKHILPGSYTALKRAIDREARAHRTKVDELRRGPARTHHPVPPADDERVVAIEPGDDEASDGAGTTVTPNAEGEHREPIAA